MYSTDQKICKIHLFQTPLSPAETAVKSAILLTLTLIKIEIQFFKQMCSIDVKMSFENKTISIYGSGKYTRDYIYIDDVVMALINVSVISYSEILKNPKSVLNVSSGRGTYIRTVFNLILEEVGKITGENLKTRNVPWPNGVSEIEKRNFIGSAERLKSLTGWAPKTPIEEGVKLLVNYYGKEFF